MHLDCMKKLEKACWPQGSALCEKGSIKNTTFWKENVF